LVQGKKVGGGALCGPAGVGGGGKANMISLFEKLDTKTQSEGGDSGFRGIGLWPFGGHTKKSKLDEREFEKQKGGGGKKQPQWLIEGKTQKKKSERDINRGAGENLDLSEKPHRGLEG